MTNKKSAFFLTDQSDPALAGMLADGLWHTETLLLGPKPKFPAAAQHIKVGLVDLRRESPAQIDNLCKWISQVPDVDWIAVVTPENSGKQHVRDFIGRYCVSYQTEPLDKHRLLYAIGHAAGMRELLGGAWISREPDPSSSLLIGESAVIKCLRDDLHRIARVDAPVLITGESGTGKELVAQSIHQQSVRCDRAFVAVNCAALSPSLIHAELFGAERGAFTSAHTRRIGHLEAANGGTLFLDEIGDLPSELQALLLRFIEERTIRRLGGRENVPIDVRVIAATHIDIEAGVREGRFREDLYYRLNVLRVRVPPLRERREDLELLANTFRERFAAESAQRVVGFSRTALTSIAAHDWPGNVRELLNRVRRAVILAKGRTITPADLSFEIERSEEMPPNLELARIRAEREAVLAGLKHTAGNARRAAEILGVSRATLYRLLDKHDLFPDRRHNSSAEEDRLGI